MGVKKDALEMLVAFYKNHIGGKPIDIDKVVSSLNFDNVQARNAFDYLKNKGLIDGTLMVGSLACGIQNVVGLQIKRKKVHGHGFLIVLMGGQP